MSLVTDRLAAALVKDVAEEHPEVVALARTLCLAAHAEPAMVRQARIRFLPRSSTGLEAQLWFSRLVEAAGSQAVVLDPAVAAELQRELAAGDPALRGAIWEFTEAQHRGAPVAVRVFEQLLWSAVEGREPDEEELRKELLPFEQTLAREDAEAAEISRWLLRFLPRLPDGARRSEAVWRLWVAAAERLGLDLPEESGAGRDPEELLAARALGQGRIAVGVSFTVDGVALSRPPAPGARVCGVTGAARARLRLRTALPGARPQLLDLYEGQQALLRSALVARLRPDGAVEAVRAEFDAELLCAYGGSGAAHALAVGTAGTTGLRLEPGAGAQPVEIELAGSAARLAVRADGGQAAVAIGRSLHRVRAEDGVPVRTTVELDSVPSALGWVGSEAGPLLCLVLDGRLVLLDEDGSTTPVAHDAAVTELRCVSSSPWLAVADVAGRVHRWRVAGPGRAAGKRIGDVGARVTALALEPASGRVCWADADGAVRWQDLSDSVPQVLGRELRQVTGLALAAAGTLWIADGSPRLRRFDLGRPQSVAEERRLPFRIDQVHAQEDGALLLVGGGGPLELASEDDRLQLLTPDPGADPEDADPAPMPEWLRHSLGVAPRGGPPAPDPATWLRTARACGIGHVLVDAELLAPGAPGRDLPRQAAAAGLRLVADLRPPTASAGFDKELRVLEHAAQLLESVPALRLLQAERWPSALVRDLRHLVESRADGALLAQVDGEPSDEAWASTRGFFHLVVGPAPAPEPAAMLRLTGPGRGWALPPRSQSLRGAAADVALLLALPGCREVPAELLGTDTGLGTSADGHAGPAADPDPDAGWLRGLLAVREQQLAVARGHAEAVPAGPRGVVAVRRSYHGEEVLCLTNTGGRAAAARIERRPDEDVLLEVASHRDGGDVAQPSVLHPRADGFEVSLRPGRARWFRVLSRSEALALGLSDPGPSRY